MTRRDDVHRFDGEYWKRSEWSSMPDADARVRLALGPTPLTDLRHRVPPLALPPAADLDAPAGYHDALGEDGRLRLRRRFARPVEMTLLASGRPFPARAIWRAAYAVGLAWGDLDLFHWRDPSTGARHFSLHALGGPGYFLPERVVEGEAVAGIALAFEPALSPDPRAVHGRMALALAHFRETLGGRPVAESGAELDGAALAAQADALDDLVLDMERHYLRPGSPAALRFF